MNENKIQESRMLVGFRATFCVNVSSGARTTMNELLSLRLRAFF